MTKRGALRRWVWESHGSCRRPDRIENRHLVAWLLITVIRSELSKVSEVNAGELLQYAGSKAQRVQDGNVEDMGSTWFVHVWAELIDFRGSQLRSQSWWFPVPCLDWQPEFSGEARNDFKPQQHWTALTFDGFPTSLCTSFYPVVSFRVKYFVLRKPVLSDWRRVDGRDRVSKCLSYTWHTACQNHPNVWKIMGHCQMFVKSRFLHAGLSLKEFVFASSSVFARQDLHQVKRLLLQEPRLGEVRDR